MGWMPEDTNGRQRKSKAVHCVQLLTSQTSSTWYYEPDFEMTFQYNTETETDFCCLNDWLGNPVQSITFQQREECWFPSWSWIIFVWREIIFPPPANCWFISPHYLLLKSPQLNNSHWKKYEPEKVSPSFPPHLPLHNVHITSIKMVSLGNISDQERSCWVPLLFPLSGGATWHSGATRPGAAGQWWLVVAGI